MYILFYSNKCKYCDSIIDILKAKNLYNGFKTISIDNNSNLPPYITRVPTLIVPDINKPLEGKNAFMWINTVFNFNNETNNINNETHNIINNKTNKTNKTNNTISGPGGFTKEEMGGVSDSFAFVADESDNKMKKNYNYIEDGVENDIEIPKIILNNDNQQEQLNHMIEERKKQDQRLVEGDEIDDLVDLAYNGVQNANRSTIHGDVNRPIITTKKQTGVTQKKINIGMSGYRLRQFK
jgi:hypothetical protein